MKVGGGGSERFMVAVPLVLGIGLIVYGLGGPGPALIILEKWAQDGWAFIRNLFS